MPRNLDHYHRLYLRSGRVAHLVHSSDWSAHEVPHARCGLGASTTYWLGTGAQEEYDKAAALPLCQNCLRFG